MTKIFVTGVTGYIGGDAVHAIANAHPEYDFTCLVRNSDKAASVAKDYASFKFVYGDLESTALIEQEAKKADIVLNFASSSHEASLKAIIAGLSSHSPSSPGFLIHTSGTGILMHADVAANRYGEPSDKVYNDLDGLHEVRSIPKGFSNRTCEELVLEAGKDYADRVKTAVVCGPCIYGQGRGPGNQRSMQIPELVRNTLLKGRGITVGKGKDIWSGIHVHDLSVLFLKLVENAAAGESLAEWPGKPALWGEDGFFFCESGDVKFDEVASWIVEDAKRKELVEKNAGVKQVTKEEALELTHRGDVLWGCNSRSKARRAREALSWKPEAMSLREVVREDVDREAAALGLTSSHAKVAAGDA